MSTTSADLRFVVLTAAGLALFPFALHLIGGYAGLASQILVTAIAAIGFNLMLGYTGMLSYGQAMFFGGGAYVTGILLMRVMPQQPNLWLAVLGAMLATALLAAVVGALVVRLYGIYFALLTLAFAQTIFFIVEQAKDWTNGDDGLLSLPAAKLPIGPWRIDPAQPFPAFPLGPFGDLSDLKIWYVIAAVTVLLVLVFVRVLVRSQFGEVLAAIRENEERSLFVGFQPRLYRLAAFIIAGALTGLSGSLRAMLDGSVPIDAVSIDRSGSLVIYTVVGGVGTILGPLVGTAAIMYLENVLSGKFEAWRLLEGLIFVAVIVFLPSGVVGSFLRRRTTSRKALGI